MADSTAKPLFSCPLHKMSKIYVAGAGWCGYTQKAIKKIKADGLQDRFNILNCSPKEGETGFMGQNNSDAAACKELQKQKLGFPTFMTCDSDAPDATCSVVQVGHTENLEAVLTKA